MIVVGAPGSPRLRQRVKVDADGQRSRGHHPADRRVPLVRQRLRPGCGVIAGEHHSRPGAPKAMRISRLLARSSVVTALYFRERISLSYRERLPAGRRSWHMRADHDAARHPGRGPRAPPPPPIRSGHMRRSVPRSRCVFALAGDSGEPWRPQCCAGGHGTSMACLPPHSGLVCSLRGWGVPDGYLVVPWVPGGGAGR